MNYTFRMENKNIKLIDGTFDPNEAKKIISGVLNSKINYHNLDAFSNQIRFDSDNLKTTTRIQELQNSNSEVLELVEFAKNNNLKLKIESQIFITLV